MRVLLNATCPELERLGGDFVLYRDWSRLTCSGLSFQFLPDGQVRRGLAFGRKCLEKLCRTGQPAWLRRRLLLASRYLYFPPSALAGIDLVYSHLLYPWPATGVPVVWSSQGISPRVYYERYNTGQWTLEDVAYVYRVLGRRADALVIPTEVCARNVAEWCPELAEKIHVVPAPVFVEGESIPPKPSLQDGRLRFLFVGVDAERKGLPEVVQAFRVLRQRHPQAQLDIVSHPPTAMQDDIKALAGATLFASSPAVDVKALMAAADVFVLPTRADTYALAAVEAMAHGCAVIVSDLEPLPEIIPDGKVGFAVPVGDISALASKLELLASEPNLLRQQQENARRRYRELHAPAVVAKRLAQVSEQVVRRRRRPAGPNAV